MRLGTTRQKISEILPMTNPNLEDISSCIEEMETFFKNEENEFGSLNY
jgi:hypothetical protein